MKNLILSLIILISFSLNTSVLHAQTPGGHITIYLHKHAGSNAHRKITSSIDGVFTEAGIMLTWVTARKLHDKHFELQYSTDGANFTYVTSFARSSKKHARYAYRFAMADQTQREVFFRLVTVDPHGKRMAVNSIYLTKKDQRIVASNNK